MDTNYLRETRRLTKKIVAQTQRLLDEEMFRRRFAYWEDQVTKLPLTAEHDAAMRLLCALPDRDYVKVCTWDSIQVDSNIFTLELGMTCSGARFRRCFHTRSGPTQIDYDLRDAPAIAHLIARKDDLAQLTLRERLIEAMFRVAREEVRSRSLPENG